MANQKEHRMVAMPAIRTDGISLNHQTVGNLTKYLQMFPADAKVVIHNTDRTGDYRIFDCQIACNFDHQKENNLVQLMPGWMVDGSEDD